MDIHQVDEEKQSCTLAQNERYSFFYCKGSTRIDLNSIAALPLSGTLLVNGRSIPQGKLLLASAKHFILEGEEFLASGMRGTFTQSYDLLSIEQVKKVSKPWGYELWYSGEGRPFAFKKLFIQAGKRLSLQYHEKKRETQFLYSGEMKLYSYPKKFSGVSDIDLGKIEQHPHSPKVAIDIPPMTIHRMEAITDITIFEVSTPELDDVVRVQDDTARC